jgi:hypothetical protein
MPNPYQINPQNIPSLPNINQAGIGAGYNQASGNEGILQAIQNLKNYLMPGIATQQQEDDESMKKRAQAAALGQIGSGSQQE